MSGVHAKESLRFEKQGLRVVFKCDDAVKFDSPRHFMVEKRTSRGSHAEIKSIKCRCIVFVVLSSLYCLQAHALAASTSHCRAGFELHFLIFSRTNRANTGSSSSFATSFVPLQFPVNSLTPPFFEVTSLKSSPSRRVTPKPKAVLSVSKIGRTALTLSKR